VTAQAPDAFFAEMFVVNIKYLPFNAHPAIVTDKNPLAVSVPAFAHCPPSLFAPSIPSILFMPSSI